MHDQPQELRMEYERDKVVLHVQSAKVIHDDQPEKTEVYLKRKPQLVIDFVGLHINHSV